MQIHITGLEDRVSRAELRALNIETRSRRNNLLFYNIPENDNESGDDCVAVLLNFLNQSLKLKDDEINKKAMPCVHRLGFKRRGVAPDGRAWRPRPTAAALRYYGDKELILGNAKPLNGFAFSSLQDFPPEIKAARGELWEVFLKAKSENMVVKIAYPAKFVIDGIVERDMFPEWNKWTTGNYVRGTQPTVPKQWVPYEHSYGRSYIGPRISPSPWSIPWPLDRNRNCGDWSWHARQPITPERISRPRVTHGSSGGPNSRQDVSQDSQAPTGHQRTAATNEALSAADTREKTITSGWPAGDENVNSQELEPLAEAHPR